MSKSKTLAAIATAVFVLFGVSTANAGAIVADYTTLADGQAASFNLAGTTVTGSSDVVSSSFIGERGLGIAGGGNDRTLDAGESLTIDYGQLVTNVTLTAHDIPTVGNVIYEVEAFDGLTSLGAFELPVHSSAVETNDLSALFGGLSFSSITVTCVGGFNCQENSRQLGIQILSTSFDLAPTVVAVAEPGTLALLGLGLVGLGWGRRRKAS